MTNMKVPVTVYSEMTPNPSTMKFVANKHLLLPGDSVEFKSLKEAKGYSPIAEALFNFPFVAGIFITSNFITVVKTDNVPWDFITMELREFVRTWLSEGKEVLVKMPEVTNDESDQKNPDRPKLKKYKKSDFDAQINELLEKYVKPAVENDGGAIEFLGFEEGVVTVLLKGACAGCPSSTATLKGGVENLLKQHLPEVKEVVAENE
jgi:NFU1 iron-sulfur cluster scaffold homolog, mitochondrial